MLYHVASYLSFYKYSSLHVSVVTSLCLDYLLLSLSLPHCSWTVSHSEKKHLQTPWRNRIGFVSPWFCFVALIYWKRDMASAFVEGREKYVWMFVCELLRLTSFFDEFSNKYLNLCGKDITDNSVICMGVLLLFTWTSGKELIKIMALGNTF